MGKANIFIVEDDRIIAEDIRTGLIKQDFSVAGIAFSGKDALKKIEETRPDLVLMDIMLHGNMNGMEAAEYILSNFSIPVVYLTAFNDEKILDQAKLTKPYGYIIKPFEDSELRTIIEIALYKHKMEMKIKESEAWLTTTLRSIGDAVIATDPGYHIVFMNPAAVFLTGWGQKETAGKSLEEVFSVINKKTGKRLKKPARKVLHEIKTITGTEDDIVLIRKSGEEKPINFTISTIRDEKGSEIGIVLIFRDITERKKAEEALNKYHLQLEEMVEERTKNLQIEITERRVAEMALRDSENRYRNLVDHLPDIIYITDKNGNLKFINDKGLDSLEARNSEIIEAPISEYIHSDDAKSLLKVFHKVHTTGTPVSDYKFRFVSKNGRIFPVVQNLTLLKNVSNNIIGIMCIAHDISALQQAEERLREANDRLEERVLQRTAELKKTNEKLKREIEERELAEKALYNSELRYRALVENAPDIIMNLDTKGKIIFINKAPAGATIDDLAGKNVFDFVPDEYRGIAAEKFKTTIENGESENLEIYGKLTGRWFSVRLGAIIHNKTINGAIVVATDITGHRRIEDLMRLEKDLAIELNTVRRLNDGLEMCVKKALKIYGLNAAIVYLYGKNSGMMEAIYHSDVSDETVKLISGQKTISYLSNIIKSGNPFYINLEKNSGFPPDINNIIIKEKWRAVAVLPLQHRDSIIGCLLVASHSIDEIYSFLKNALEMVAAQMGNVIGRLQAEEELRESEEKFRAVFEGSSDGYLASSSEFENFVFSNPKMSEITGYTHEELLKLNISGIHPAEDLLYIIDCFNKIKEGKISIVENVPVLRKDKKIIYCDITGKNIKIGDKEYTFEIFRDITARKKAEEELRLKDFAISSSINGFIIADMEGKITYANDSLLTIWGNSLEESLGRHVTEFFESPDTAIDAMKALLENGKWTGELKGKKKDGSVFYILLSANLVKNNHGDPLYMMGSVLDITERKLSEKALKESEEKYREIFNNVQVGLTRTRISDGKILDCNELFAKLTGFKSREECIASGVTSLHYKDPALRNRVVKELYEKGKVDMVETEATKADGTPFWVSYSARLIPGENCIEGAIIDITRRKEAEDALRISEERFRRLSEAAEEGIAIHDQGLIIEANEALARMFGYDLPELIGLHAEKLATPETWKVILDHLSTNNDGPYEGTGVKKNGTEFWCRLSGKPYQYKGRTLRVATFIDIGERKSAEDLIRIQRDIMVTLGSTTDLSKAFDQILQILLQRDEIDCGALYLVDARSEAYLISHANFSPEFLEKISHYSPDTPQAQLIKEGKAFYQPYSELTFSHDKVREKEGLRAMAIIPIRHEGKPVACINLSSHIHNEIPMNFRTMLESLAAQLGEIIIRIETRKALEDSEYKFATAFKSSASMMAISTLEEGRFIEVNDEFLNKLGYQRDEIIGNTSGKLWVFSDIRQWETIKQIALRENFARNLEVTLRTKNGVLLDCLFSAHVIILDGVTCWLTVAHDITERIRMETFLHIQHDLSIALSGVTEIKEALNLVLEAGTSYEDINAGGIYLVNAEMGGLDLISYKNLSADFVKQNSRYGPEEEKVKIIKIGRPAYASTHDNIDKAALEAEGLKSLAVMPILHQGRVVACMNIASRIYEEIPEAARNFLESIASQVGGAISRLRFEKELKDSEEKFRAITENSSDMIVIISIDGKYTYISPALVKLLGYSSGELIGKTPSLYIYPDDLSLLEDAAARSLENPGTPISLRDFRAYKRNRDALILSGTIINMLDIKGVEGIVGVFHDVTERKRMEEQIQNHNRLLQEAIRKTEWEMEELMEKHLRIEKLAAIGQVYGNIAHEIRNPLGAIKQSVFFLKRKLKAYPDKIQEHLDLIDRELVKTNNVISNMLTSIDIKRTKHRIVDLQTVINEAVTRCKINENIKFTFKTEEEKLSIPGDSIQLQQVFINLITNASQAIGNEGSISITVKKTGTGDKVQIKIKDDGIGIESEALPKVFTPLYTTKKNGTGLGLGICKQIIEQHGGEIDLQSKPQSGTIVSVTLPTVLNLNNKDG